jgi:hypothetical protein
MTTEKTERPTKMKLKQAWNGSHPGVDDHEINYNVVVSPFSIFGEK